MKVSGTGRTVATIGVLAAWVPAVARAGDLIDTRVTFTIADDDVARGPEDGSPSSPNSAPDESNRLFFDDFERRDLGFENLTHVVVYSHLPGFIDGVDTRAALVLRMEILGGPDDGGVALSEDGSYLEVSYSFTPEYALRLTAFPVNADRFQLGYSYDIAWGGSRMFGGDRNRLASPGLKLSFDGGRFGAYAGWKTAVKEQLTSDETIEPDTVWGVLAGGHVDVVEELRLEAGAGFFQRGVLDQPELRIPRADGGLDVAPWQGFGGSVQVTYHVGLPIGTPIDFRLYENDPLRQQLFFAPEPYGEGLSFLVQSEASVVGQTLQDPEFPASTTVQLGLAIDLAAKVKWNNWRFHALGVFRNLAFILYDVPSFAPFVDFPDGIEPAPEVFFSLGADYFFDALHLTPGVVLGVRAPAHVTAAIPGGSGPSMIQTIVVRDANEWLILSPGERVQPVFASKLTGRFDFSEIIAAVGELQLSYDENRRRRAMDELGVAVWLPGEPVVLGFNLMLQGRF